jgi:hypothetical protein
LFTTTKKAAANFNRSKQQPEGAVYVYRLRFCSYISRKLICFLVVTGGGGCGVSVSELTL